MTPGLYLRPEAEDVPPIDPRDHRVIPIRPVDYPQTEATIRAAKTQQRWDRAAAIAEPDDPERAVDARLMIDALADEFGADRVHRWARAACLIRAGVCPCRSLDR